MEVDISAVSEITLSMGAVITVGTDLVMATTLLEHAGIASAISVTVNEFGSSLGMTILDSIGGVPQ